MLVTCFLSSVLSVTYHSLPTLDRPIPGVVSVDSTVREDGRVCLIVHNGTPDKLHYDRVENRGGKSNLERQVVWSLWVGVRYANIRQWWNDLFSMRTLPIVSSLPIPAGETRSHLLPHDDIRMFTPGRYRVCFRFRQGNHSTWQEECSAPFRLPP